MTNRNEKNTARILFAFVMALLCLFAGHSAEAQWTEPDSTSCPQFGSGIRSPWLSNDGLRLYLCTIDNIYVVTRDSLGSDWGPLTLLPNHINYTSTQVCACESPSGDTLYFMSDSDQRPGEGYGWYDIYYSVRTDTGWGPAINCGPNVNGPGREWSVGISRDGNTLLISSGGPQGLYLDLYYCEKQSDGTWGPAIDFGPNINSNAEGQHPTLSPDNSRLFFYREGPNSGDVMESHKVNGVWQTATSLPPPINDPFRTQRDPCISPDGRTLWYCAEQTYNLYDFQIVTSVDTSILSIGRDAPERSRQPAMRLETDGASLIITMSGVTTARDADFFLYDILGREVSSGRITLVNHGSSSLATWPLTSLAAGTYLVRLNVNNTSMHSTFVHLP